MEEGHPRAKNLQRAVNHLDAYLAATQLGITMSSLGLGWLGEPAIAALVEPLFHIFLPEKLAVIGSHTIAVAIAFSIITALHIVLGELAPKVWLCKDRKEPPYLWCSYLNCTLLFFVQWFNFSIAWEIWLSVCWEPGNKQ